MGVPKKKYSNPNKIRMLQFDSPYDEDYSTKYRIVHAALGGICGIDSIPLFYRMILLSFFSIYQLGQLVLNIRIFFDEKKILSGNSGYHTLNKTLDYLYGYVLVVVILYFVRIR